MPDALCVSGARWSNASSPCRSRRAEDARTREAGGERERAMRLPLRWLPLTLDAPCSEAARCRRRCAGLHAGRMLQQASRAATAMKGRSPTAAKAEKAGTSPATPSTSGDTTAPTPKEKCSACSQGPAPAPHSSSLCMCVCVWINRRISGQSII